MRRQIVGSVRAGESVTRVAERLLDIGDPAVNLPKHVRQLRDAARWAKETGQPDLYEEAVAKWQGSINRLGQGAGKTAGAHSMRSATQQMVKDLRRAKPAQVDAVVDRWVIEKARYQARMIARTEAVEAFRDVYKRSHDAKPYVVGYRWTLSPGHPDPDICFPSGTMVETSEGPRPIESIEPGDEVLTHTGVMRRVLVKTRSKTDRPLRLLRFQAGSSRVLEVVSTPNHPFATASGWMRADALRIGDFGVGLRAASGMHARPLGDGTVCTSQSGSRRSAPSEHQKTSGAGRCAEPLSNANHTGTEDASRPSIWLRWFESGMRRSLATLPTIAGSFLRLAAQKAVLAGGRAFATFPGGVSHSWDSHFQPMPFLGMRWNRMFDRGCLEGTPPDTARTAQVESGALSGSSHWSSSGDHWAVLSRIPRMAREVAVWLSQRIFGRSNSGEYGPFHQQPRLAWGSLGYDIGGIRLLCAQETATTDGWVFNIEVDADHTYFANGVLVHNCDVLANQDMHGMGAGGYPKDGLPTTPHPHDLCSQIAIVDSAHFKRRTAIAQGKPEPPKPWLSGKSQDGNAWLRSLPDDQLRRTVGPTRAAMLREGHQVMDATGGQLRPVHELQGRPAPVRDMGPSVRAARIVRADRAAGQVMPFPRVRPAG